MTFHIKLSILALIMGFSIIDVQAAENTNLEQKETLAKVDVSIDIFPLKGELTIDDYPEILKENKPESSPRFTAIAGEPNSVDISSKELIGIQVALPVLSLLPITTQANLTLILKWIKVRFIP